jgi:hypothetical protein
MSLITYPIATEFEAFCPQNFAAQMRVNQRAHASPFGGSEQVVDMLNDRWAVTMDLPPCTQADAGKREAFFNALRGQVNHTELYHFGRPTPRGTLASAQGLIVDAPQGAASVTIATTPGATLLAGDMIGVDGLLLQCAADCVADGSGVLVVPLVNRLRRAIAALHRASTATFIDSAGVLQTAAVDVLRYSYFGGKNIYSGPVDLVAGPGVYGATHELKSPTNNPANLMPGETITASAEIYQDAASLADGAGRVSRLYLWFADAVGTWQGSAIVSSSALQPTGRLSVSITLPALASDMTIVGIGVFHIDGNATYLGTVRADAVMVERGAVATAYEPGAQLLVEGAATNFVLESQDLSSSAYWFGAVSAGLSTPPWAGSVPIYGLSKTTAGSSEFRAQTVARATSAGEQLVMTVALLGHASTDLCDVGLSDDSTPWGPDLLSSAEIISGPGSLSQVGGGLWRVSGLTPAVHTLVRITRTYSVSSAEIGVYLYPGSSVSTTIGHAVLATRVQVEAGPTATSYIPTTTAPATRAADIITPVIWDRPTAPFRLASPVAPRYVPGYAEGLSLDFVEKVD